MTRDGVARLARRADGTMQTVGRGAGLVAGLFFLALAVFIVIDVVGRRIGGVSSGATDEVTSLTAAVGTAAAFVYTYTSRAHVVIDVIVTKFPERVQRWLRIVADLMLAGFAGIVGLVCWNLASVSLTNGTVTIGLGVPLALTQALIAVMAFLLMFAALVHSARQLVDPSLEQHEEVGV